MCELENYSETKWKYRNVNHTSGELLNVTDRMYNTDNQLIFMNSFWK